VLSCAHERVGRTSRNTRFSAYRRLPDTYRPTPQVTRSTNIQQPAPDRPRFPRPSAEHLTPKVSPRSQLPPRRTYYHSHSDKHTAITITISTALPLLLHLSLAIGLLADIAILVAAGRQLLGRPAALLRRRAVVGGGGLGCGGLALARRRRGAGAGGVRRAAQLRRLLLQLAPLLAGAIVSALDRCALLGLLRNETDLSARSSCSSARGWTGNRTREDVDSSREWGEKDEEKERKKKRKKTKVERTKTSAGGRWSEFAYPTDRSVNSGPILSKTSGHLGEPAPRLSMQARRNLTLRSAVQFTGIARTITVTARLQMRGFE